MAAVDKLQNEIERDTAMRFYGEQYVSKGYYMHFHRNIEIYGIVSGKVSVTVAGQQATLTDGQIAVIDGLENHSYEIDGKAEVFYLHIGTRYSSKLYSLYPNQRLPFFLMDAAYNQNLYKVIKPALENPDKFSELKRLGFVYQLFADIIDHYGLMDKSGYIRDDYDVVTKVVQYIYEHYSEPITLESLSKEFFISPKALSKKIRKRLNVDLRLFINDIRVQKAVQFRDDPAYKGKSLNEIALSCGFNNMVTFYRSYERNFRFHKLDKE
ncbi:MAG: helix-turn-helix domain-containing protein [Oscillospiraceae bacterium]|nr:helix-turn-helix domain-containing protein [Oscillospiraceae bacterium]